MTSELTKSDRQVLKKIMAEPDFKAIRNAAIAANIKRQQDVVDMLRNCAPDNTEGHAGTESKSKST